MDDASRWKTIASLRNGADGRKGKELPLEKSKDHKPTDDVRRVEVNTSHVSVINGSRGYSGTVGTRGIDGLVSTGTENIIVANSTDTLIATTTRLTNTRESINETTRALEILVNNCLANTPTNTPYSHYTEWLKDFRTVTFRGPRRMGSSTALINVVRNHFFNPCFLFRTLHQGRMLVRSGVWSENFGTNNLPYRINTQLDFERDPNRIFSGRDFDCVVVDDSESFSEDCINSVYRLGAPGLQCLILA